MKPLFGALTLVASLIGSLASRGAPRGRWYRSLRKSRANPPPWVFAVVWPALYGMMAWSGARVAEKGDKAAVALWLTQLAFNAAWSPLFFAAHRPRAALADLGLTFASATAYTWRARRTDGAAAAVMVPYLSWLAFASTLNAAVIRKNAPLLRG